MCANDRLAAEPQEIDLTSEYDADLTEDMEDGMTGIDKGDIFAIVDLSDEQTDITTDLWNHPGVKDTVNRLNRIAQVNERFKGRRIEKPQPRNLEPSQLNDPQEVYVPPSEPNAFPEIRMGDLRIEFIEFVKRPIDFDQQIDEDFQVLTCSLFEQLRCTHSLCRPTRRSGCAGCVKPIFTPQKKKNMRSQSAST